MRKGISELIAAIALIGVVIVAASIVSIWGLRLTHTQETGILCVPATNYFIESVKFNTTGQNELLLKVTNEGETSLYGFSSVLENGTVNIQFFPEDIDQGGISAANPLRSGESVYLKIDLTEHPGLGESVTMVRLNNQACSQVPIAAPVTPL